MHHLSRRRTGLQRPGGDVPGVREQLLPRLLRPHAGPPQRRSARRRRRPHHVPPRRLPARRRLQGSLDDAFLPHTVQIVKLNSLFPVPHTSGSPPQACTPFSPYNVMYSGWMGDDDSSFLGLRACAHKVHFGASWAVCCVCVLPTSTLRVFEKCLCSCVLVFAVNPFLPSRPYLPIASIGTYRSFLLSVLVIAGDLLGLDGLRQLRLRHR